jgi:aryl-alcohol dehydrogenase-like predicted oxidoreductase
MNRTCELGLGTVQWGLSYGVSNSGGVVPSRAEVASILKHAAGAAVTVLDTAPNYGDVEDLLGQIGVFNFRVVTKVSKLRSDVSPTHADAIRSSILNSQARLGCGRLAGVLLHCADDLLGPHGHEAARALLDAKDLGLVERVGFSAYDPSSVRQACKVLQPDIVQVPLNVLDQRLVESGCLAELKDSGVEVHVRSVFLQGLLLMETGHFPPHLAHLAPRLQRWESAVDSSGLTRMAAALAFARAVPGVDTVLVGTCTYSQFQDVLAGFATRREFDARGLSLSDPSVIDPRKWDTACSR